MTDTTAPASLVSSGNVNGTAVFSADGTEIGHIDHLMIDKKSGKVAYAVMGFGGFLGDCLDLLAWPPFRSFLL